MAIAMSSFSAPTSWAQIIAFDDMPIEQPPVGFTMGLTGGGGSVSWVVQLNSTAPSGDRVLAQTSTDRTNDRFPLCFLDGFVARDVDVSVKLKAVAGAIDRAGGLIVRAKDASNYYVVRANALEDNVRFYRVVDGRRTQIGGRDLNVSSNAWHTLRLRAVGRRFEVFFNSTRLFTADDSTFQEPGRIALWTKADSVTYFDDLTFAAGQE